MNKRLFCLFICRYRYYKFCHFVEDLFKPLGQITAFFFSNTNRLMFNLLYWLLRSIERIVSLDKKISRINMLLSFVLYICVFSVSDRYCAGCKLLHTVLDVCWVDASASFLDLGNESFKSFSTRLLQTKATKIYIP